MPAVGERRSKGGETREWTGSRWERVAAPTEGPNGMHLPGLYESPTEATMSEIGRTAKEAGIGLARSPLDALKGLMGLPRTVVEGLLGQNGLPALVKDPSLLLEAPAAAKQAVTDLGNNPREAGSLLGQTLLGAKAPKIVSGATKVAGKVPAGMVATGEAMARGGQTMKDFGGMSVGGVKIPMSTLGLGEAVMRMDPAGLAVAASPYALEYGGKGLAAGGRALEALKASRAPKTAAPAGAPPNAGLLNPGRFSTEVPYKADLLTDLGTAPRESGPSLSEKLAGEMNTYERPGIPDEFMDRAADMGRDSLAALRSGGYTVPDRGITSSRDIDMMGSGRGAPTKPIELPSSSKALMDEMNPELPPSFEDSLPDVPEFTYEAGEPDVPGLTVEMARRQSPAPKAAKKASTSARRPVAQSKQTAALEALMASPSFRSLR